MRPYMKHAFWFTLFVSIAAGGNYLWQQSKDQVQKPIQAQAQVLEKSQASEQPQKQEPEQDPGQPADVINAYHLAVQNQESDKAYEMLSEYNRKQFSKEHFGIFTASMSDIVQIKSIMIGDTFHKTGRPALDADYDEYDLIETTWTTVTPFRSEPRTIRMGETVVKEDGKYKILFVFDYGMDSAKGIALSSLLYTDGIAGKKVDFAKAEERIQAARSLYDQPYIHLALANLYMKKDQNDALALEETKKTLPSIVDLEEKAIAHGIMGLCYLHMGMKKEAQAEYRLGEEEYQLAVQQTKNAVHPAVNSFFLRPLKQGLGL